ncbi:MAG: sensor histidine kinase [Thermoleophilia bacterium]
MTSIAGLARRLRPHSLRARIALALVAALLLALVVVQVLIGGFVRARERDQLERAMRVQADSIARAVQQGGPERATVTAREANAFVGDARLVVWWDGENQYWNNPVSDLEASVEVTRGPVRVLLERPDPGAGVFSDAGFVSLVALALVASGGFVWFLASGVASRLRRSVRDLAASADAVSAGRLDVHAEETDDELGRVAVAFNHMTERLRESDERQRAFLADIAHELRTPITSIEGFSEALVDGTARTDEDRAEAVRFIRAEAARLHTLVQDLRELTYLDLDPPVNAEEVDLAAAAREAAARLASRAGAEGVDVTWPKDAAVTVTDPGHVETILANLLSNAIAATPRGGSVRLEIVTLPGTVGVSVHDTGRGIPPEHIPYLFDRLYRVEPGRQRDAGGGSGLGLSIVQRLARLLGGRVAVRSTVGSGSTFTLWLPARAVAPRPSSGVGSKPPA